MLSSTDKRKIRRILHNEKFRNAYPNRMQAAKGVIAMIRLLKQVSESLERGEWKHGDMSTATVSGLRMEAAENGIELTPQEMTEVIEISNHCRRMLEG